MEKRYLWQASVLPAVSSGFVSPVTTVGEASSHGDSGICSVAGTGGLACIVNGVCRTSCTEGGVLAADDIKLCQATVGDFDPYASVFLCSQVGSIAAFQEVLEGRPEIAKTRNSVHMVLGAGRIGHAFLSETSAEGPEGGQAASCRKTVQEHRDVEGTVLGVRRPNYLEVGGKSRWRFVFLAEDGGCLGHLLGCSDMTLACQITRFDGLVLDLPQAKAFSKADIRV